AVPGTVADPRSGRPAAGGVGPHAAVSVSAGAAQRHGTAVAGAAQEAAAGVSGDDEGADGTVSRRQSTGAAGAGGGGHEASAAGGLRAIFGVPHVARGPRGSGEQSEEPGGGRSARPAAGRGSF